MEPPSRPLLAPTHPAFLAALLVTAATVLWSVTFRLIDTDFWQHLLVGKAIWQLQRVPTTQLWTWPTFGQPDVNASWGFRALIWPLWKLGGVWGLFAWRWASTLAAFTLLWFTARRMGARGLSPLAVVATCAVLYRLRSQVRPETLVAVLMAIEILVLETRRHGGRDHSAWLVPLATVWANSHISYFLFFVVLGAHAVNDLAGGGAPGVARPDPPGAGGGVRALFAGRYRLWLLAPLSLLAMLVNPWGWRALWQPFAYFLFWRHEPIIATIGELGPLHWQENLLNGMPLVLVGTPLLFAWRWRRRGLDRVELVMLAALVAMASSSARFLGFLALGVVPYLGRDLDDWLGTRRLPAWTAWAPARVAGVAAVALGVGVPHWSLPDARMGVGIVWHQYPVDACDFIERHGVRGRVFNTFELGGYLLYRFWPERDRLPFIDIHQAGTTEDRRLYITARLNSTEWHRLDSKYRFDWVMLSRHAVGGDHLFDIVEADSVWAMVFQDDVAVIYLRRDGTLAAVADSEAYRELRAGPAGLAAVGRAAATDPERRARVLSELERVTRESSATAGAHNLLGALALEAGHPDEAERHLRQALAADPLTPRVRARLGDLALAAGRPAEALDLYRQEARMLAPPPGLDTRIGTASMRLGDLRGARAAFLRAIREDPGDEAARDSLVSLDSRH